jgi:hypothetical protein
VYHRYSATREKRDDAHCEGAGDDFEWFCDVYNNYSNTACNTYTTDSSNPPNSGDPVAATA